MNLNEAINLVKDRLAALSRKVDLASKKKQLAFLWLRIRDNTGKNLRSLYHALKNKTRTSADLIRRYAGVAADKSRIYYHRVARRSLVFFGQTRIASRHFLIKASHFSVAALQQLKHYLKILLQLIRHLSAVTRGFIVLATQHTQRIVKQFLLWSTRTSRLAALKTCYWSERGWRFFLVHLKYLYQTTISFAQKLWALFITFGRAALITGRVFLVEQAIRAALFIIAITIDTLRFSRKQISAAWTYSGILMQMLDEALTGIGEYIYIALEFTAIRLYRTTRWCLRAPVFVFKFTDWLLTQIIFVLVTFVKWLVTGLTQMVIYTVKSPVIAYNSVVPEPVANRLKLYAQLIRFDKPIGTLLLLWPTLLALWMAAEGWPDIKILLIFIAGVFIMRSAGCAINDFADREFDINVKRTKDRPLAAGKISEKEALAVFIVLALIAFILVLQLNELTIGLSMIGVVLVASYPFMKRYHYIPQAHLGVAFGWAVPMAWAAQANELTPIAGLLFFATILWTTAYDTMYAMVDYEDDIKIGVKSTAILFGNADKIIIAVIQMLLILDLVLIGIRLELTGFYYTGVLLAALLALWQQYLIRDREPALCFKAFLNNNWLGLVLFAGLFCEYQFGGVT